MEIRKGKGMYNQTRKQATLKYLKGLKEIRFRVTLAEYERYKEAAQAQGYTSMRQFYMDAINEKIGRG